jgi:hypothetical protein
LQKAQIIVMENATERLPKDTFRQLWYRDSVGKFLFVIQEWHNNAENAPKVEEFVTPQDRPGWKVLDWPFLSVARRPGRGADRETSVNATQ